ncbi:hypothetical protein RHMOL_Rhmol10G0085200 [Rhododendron molle]|uniref:Uncharacterized protein n=1 Tax=Rhododendron molle TaxID=49168 RepID=A0ACC0M1B6_RHOML|nr:hypothetical protein RHMOL_Rhmol10G0085200 [Rhododendron molle]
MASKTAVIAWSVYNIPILSYHLFSLLPIYLSLSLSGVREKTGSWELETTKRENGFAQSKLSSPRQYAPLSRAVETHSPFAMTASYLLGVGTKEELWGTHLRPKLRPSPVRLKPLLMSKLFRQLLEGGIVWLLTIKAELMLGGMNRVKWAGGNEYGQCGEEPERKDDTGRPLKRDIIIPQRCASKLSVRQVAAGGTHSVVLTREGHVWTWGQPWPPGDIKQISTPMRVQGLERVRIIAVGAFHNLALLEDGILWAWGNNEYGQLGTGDTQPRSQPIPVQGLSGLTLVDIAAGGWHSTALTDDGEVYGWGRGEHGRLGFGDDKSSKMVPQRVQLLVEEEIIQVSCGGTHSVALTRDGHMFSFGRGDHGRLGYGRKVTTGHPSEVPINLPPPKNLSGGETDGRWCAKFVACGGRHTLATVEWHPDES